MCSSHNQLVPKVATIKKITEETSSGDVKTFYVEFDKPEERAEFKNMPGQCAMISVLGVGESMISITSSPTRPDPLEFSIKKMGKVTSKLHDMSVGSKIGIRGPYGNNFPVDEWRGKDLVFIGGGIGLAPLRSVINYCIDKKENYGSISIIYGSRSPADLCFKEELFDNWPNLEGVEVHLTVDKVEEGERWDKSVGFVPQYLEQISPSPNNSIAITCGPPIMIKYVLESLEKMKFEDEQIITTLELKMQCGVGYCGRCNIGDKYVCIDGPVFSYKQIKEMPQEF
ncbi:MAG: FAD/NAD(P)-binding protein [Clostridiales bacterium]|nr:FAD/NAD(P)-binding protein [Clostridiales bacterium]